MFSKEFFYWSNKAVSKIKYKPDRDAAYTELMAHMEDRCDFFLEQGMSEQEAVEKTVAAMGDPEETADQLAAIHKPFWGYAAAVTRRVCFFTVIWCVAEIIVFLVEFFTGWGYAQAPAYDPAKWDPYLHNGDVCISYLEPKVSDSSDGYTFTLEKFAVWRLYFDEPAEDGRTYFDECSFRLVVTNPRPWMPEQKAVDWIWAEDSLGNRYVCQAERKIPDTDGIVSNSYNTRPGTYVYECQFRDFNSGEAEWIDLHYDRAGRDVVLRMDLKEGRVA